MQKHKGGNMLFTVVTVTYNAADNISQTIESVLLQDCNDFEYIIYDGLSTDGTLNLAKDYKSNYKYDRERIKISIYSEKDAGIFDAMNKAAVKAHGEFIIFLNAGDYFANNNILSKVKNTIKSSKADIIYGNHINYYNNLYKIVPAKDPEFITKGMICAHQAIFTKKELLLNVPYSTEYKMTADYNFYLSMYLDGKKFLRLDLNIAYFEVNGISQKKCKVTQQERLKLLYHYGLISKRIYFLRNIIVFFICAKKKILRMLPESIRYKNYIQDNKI